MSVTVRGAAAGIAITLVAAAIGVGVYLVGPPAEQRVRRLDERRVEGLAYLREQVRAFSGVQKRLPASLQEMPYLPSASTHDPVTNQPYGYRVTGQDTFELCADFDRPNDPDRLLFVDNELKHGVGHTCFPEVATPLRQPSK
ncbi:MAG TPA: hypothetical protein VGP84_01880 [Gemmatimonadaceae bacterium]|nr:hypothetical protein [Gemmatimonadaceae bacterium]